MPWLHDGQSPKPCQGRCVRDRGARGLGWPSFSSTTASLLPVPRRTVCEYRGRACRTPAASSQCSQDAAGPPASGGRLFCLCPFAGAVPSSQTPFLRCAANELLLSPQGPVPKSFFLCEVSLSVVSFVPPLTSHTLGSSHPTSTTTGTQ